MPAAGDTLGSSLLLSPVSVSTVNGFLGVFPYSLKGSEDRGCCILYIVQIVM